MGVLSQLCHVAYVLLFELDLAVFFGAGFSTGFVNQVLSKSQTIRPFFPQDATLWHSFSGDTIHTGIVFLILYVVFAPALYFVERHRLHQNGVLHTRARRSALRIALGLLTSTMLTILVVELGKGYVGALRPSFARVCLSPAEPPFPSDAVPRQVYRANRDCPTDAPHKLEDARRSFPSGHAALAVGGATYAQLVLLRYARAAHISEHAAIAVLLLGASWALFAAWVSASRIMDNAHHVADVAVGAVLGLWGAVVHFWFVVGRNERAEQRDLQMKESSQS